MDSSLSTGATRIKYEALIWREGSQVVAHAWPLDVASSGETEEHALRMLAEAVQLFVETTKDMGTLDDILEECGYERVGDVWEFPKVSSVKQSCRLPEIESRMAEALLKYFD